MRIAWALIGVFLLALVIGFWGAQVSATYYGLQLLCGASWAMALVFLALVLRWSMFFTLGAFWGAWQAWGWHWALALVFAMPGVLWLLPGGVGLLFAVMVWLFGGRWQYSSPRWGGYVNINLGSEPPRNEKRVN